MQTFKELRNLIPRGIDCARLQRLAESISGLLKSLQIRALVSMASILSAVGARTVFGRWRENRIRPLAREPYSAVGARTI